MDNVNNIKEEEYKKIQDEYNKLKEKSLLYKLKRWEKILLQQLGNIISRFKLFKDYKEEIKNKMINLMKILKKKWKFLKQIKK